MLQAPLDGWTGFSNISRTQNDEYGLAKVFASWLGGAMSRALHSIHSDPPQRSLFRGTCLLNFIAVDQPEYDAAAFAKLFQKNPSIWLAMCLALGVYIVGLRPRFALMCEWTSLFLLASIPISLWIWDIPFAGQPICRCCHDLRLSLPLLGAIRSRTIYLLCIGLFASLVAVRTWVHHLRAKAQSCPPVAG